MNGGNEVRANVMRNVLYARDVRFVGIIRGWGGKMGPESFGFQVGRSGTSIHNESKINQILRINKLFATFYLVLNGIFLLYSI